MIHGTLTSQKGELPFPFKQAKSSFVYYTDNIRKMLNTKAGIFLVTMVISFNEKMTFSRHLHFSNISLGNILVTL